MKKLKRVVIKEELVALTEKVEHAIVLNQFIYWSERVKDVDQFLKEEKERARKFSDGSTESEEEIKETLSNGWIYKTAAEMKEECMFEKSDTTMERIMVALVDKGWLDRRRNPKYKWDKTYQYRVNILTIQRDLLRLGYALEGYSLGEINDADTKLQNEDSNIQNEGSTLHNEDSRLQFEGAIPEITSESTLNKEEEEPIAHSNLMYLLLSNHIPIDNAQKFETRLLKEGLTGYTDEDVLKAIEKSLADFHKGICDEPYIWAVGKLKRILDNKGKGINVAPQKPKRKSTRTELLPDWFDKQEELPSVDPVAKKQEIDDMLKKLREE